MVLKVIQRHCRGLLAALFLAFSAGAALAQAGAIYTATGIDVDAGIAIGQAIAGIGFAGLLRRAGYGILRGDGL